jgi:hypothetical protein
MEIEISQRPEWSKRSIVNLVPNIFGVKCRKLLKSLIKKTIILNFNPFTRFT